MTTETIIATSLAVIASCTIYNQVDFIIMQIKRFQNNSFSDRLIKQQRTEIMELRAWKQKHENQVTQMYSVAQDQLSITIANIDFNSKEKIKTSLVYLMTKLNDWYKKQLQEAQQG